MYILWFFGKPGHETFLLILLCWKMRLFCLIFKHGKVFFTASVTHQSGSSQTLGLHFTNLPTVQILFRREADVWEWQCQRYFALFESSSCFRPEESRPRRFLSVINCLQFCTGKPLYHTIWDPFFASTNPPLSVSME